MKLSICFISLLILLLLPLAVAAGEIVLVVHPDNSTMQLELQEIRNIFLGQTTRWGNGRGIVVLLQKDNDLQRQFATEVLDKSPRQLQMHWKRILFSGLGIPPRELTDDQTIITAVAADPRAIGYVARTNVNEGVKVIHINPDQGKP